MIVALMRSPSNPEGDRPIFGGWPTLGQAGCRRHEKPWVVAELKVTVDRTGSVTALSLGLRTQLL